MIAVQYLEMIDDVMRNGVFRGDRTGTGTYSKFGTSMRFNLRQSFPLLTSKRVFWRGGRGRGACAAQARCAWRNQGRAQASGLLWTGQVG